MNKTLRALLERKTKLVAEARVMLDAVGAEQDMSTEDQAAFDAIQAKIASVNSSIEREKALIAEEDSMQALDIPDNADITGGAPAIEQDPRRGFASYGEFAISVLDVHRNHVIDPRLNIGAAAPATYGSEGVGVDGGHLIPAEFSRNIYHHSLDEDSFLPLTDNTPVTGNSMTFPSDETTPWGTTGIVARWEAEAAAAAPQKPNVKPRTLRLNKLMALIAVTEELQSDAVALGSYLSKKTGSAIRWKTNDSIVNGTGAGQPAGIASAGALVSQAKETSQTADTIVAANIAKMFGRMPASSISRAVWIVNNDAFHQLITMTVGNAPIWTPPATGMVNAPSGLLLGRPLRLSQSCQTLGDAGDIYFVDLESYQTISKQHGIETATSMHLYFDANAVAFRVTFRVDGQPAIQSAITPANGSNTLSPFVTLAERA